MSIIFTLIIVDYILTFIGIQFNIIEEANPIMQGLLNLDFGQGLFIRILLAILLLIPFYICKNKDILFYKKSVISVIMIYIPVMTIHAIWIFRFLTS